MVNFQQAFRCVLLITFLCGVEAAKALDDSQLRPAMGVNDGGGKQRAGRNLGSKSEGAKVEMNSAMTSKSGSKSGGKGGKGGEGGEEKDCSDFEACEIDCDQLTECHFPGFDPHFLGDGFCDTTGCYNHKICGFDGGDCCESTCDDGPEYTCGDNGFDCKLISKGANELAMLEEPPEDCTLLTSCDWPGIIRGRLGDGFCDTSSCYNSRACSFDRGDCCEETCPAKKKSAGQAFECGINGYDCKLAFEPASCPDKILRIIRWCIDGETDDSGSEAEVKISLAEEREYYPEQVQGDETICDGNEVDDQGDDGLFCFVPENSCLEMTSSKEKKFDSTSSAFTLVVGFEEDDSTSGNDYQFGSAAPEQWYSDDCRPYEVQIFREFEAKSSVTSCYSINGSGGAKLKGVGLEVGGGFERCSQFEEPAKKYIWFLDVRPDPDSPLNPQL